MYSFEYLLQRYISKTITGEERVELFANYREELVDYFYKSEGYGSYKSSREEVLHRILATQPELAEAYYNAFPMERSKFWNIFARIAMAAMVVLAVGVTLYFYTRPSSEDHVAVNQEAPAASLLETINGPRFVKLPDGSTVILNAGSTLKYLPSFKESLREVTLDGEAFFDISPDPERKFIVRSGKVTTSVLGTAFNIKTLPEGKISVTVTRGKVHVGDDQKDYGVLTPNEKLEVDTKTHLSVKAIVNSQDELAWKKDFIIIDNLLLNEAFGIVADKYHVKVIIANEALKNCRVTSTFLHQTELETVVKAITTTSNATYTIKNDTVTIEGEGCK